MASPDGREVHETTRSGEWTEEAVLRLGREAGEELKVGFLLSNCYQIPWQHTCMWDPGSRPVSRAVTYPIEGTACSRRRQRRLLQTTGRSVSFSCADCTAIEIAGVMCAVQKTAGPGFFDWSHDA